MPTPYPFRATHPPRGRLARLGVVLDLRNAPARVREVAVMCERAGIDAVWVRDQLSAEDGEPRLEAWTALSLVAPALSRIRVGAALTIGFRPPAVLAAMAGTLDSAMSGRLELALSSGRLEREHLEFGLEFPDGGELTERLEAYAVIVRDLLAGDPVTSAGPYPLRGTELGVASPQPGGPPLSVEAASPSQIRVAARVADDVLVPAMAVSDIEGAIGQIHEACLGEGRDPATLGIALEIPVSVGRTEAEAHARADADSLFHEVGHPAEVGIFGTLEQCQDRVLQMAHAGVTDLRCLLPNSPDVHDVIAQLTAMVVGSVDVLTPGTPRSKAPDPPQGWGGRSPGA